MGNSPLVRNLPIFKLNENPPGMYRIVNVLSGLNRNQIATWQHRCRSNHVSKTIPSCFVALWQVRSTQHPVCRVVLLSLVMSPVLSRLDYGSATLTGIPIYLLNHLQSVLNTTPRLICWAHKYNKYDHVFNNNNNNNNNKWTTLLTVSRHADRKALLEATVLASVTIETHHKTATFSQTTVFHLLLHTPPKETLSENVTHSLHSQQHSALILVPCV